MALSLNKVKKQQSLSKPLPLKSKPLKKKKKKKTSAKPWSSQNQRNASPVTNTSSFIKDIVLDVFKSLGQKTPYERLSLQIRASQKWIQSVQTFPKVSIPIPKSLINKTKKKRSLARNTKKD